MNAKVRDVMTSKVFWVRQDAPVKDMAAGMHARRDGVVTLAGDPETAALGRDLVEEVRHVQGVVAVRDCQTYPEDDVVVAPGFNVTAPR